MNQRFFDISLQTFRSKRSPKRVQITFGWDCGNPHFRAKRVLFKIWNSNKVFLSGQLWHGWRDPWWRWQPKLQQVRW